MKIVTVIFIIFSEILMKSFFLRLFITMIWNILQKCTCKRFCYKMIYYVAVRVWSWRNILTAPCTSKISTWKGHNDMAILLDKSVQKSFFVGKIHVRTITWMVIGRIFSPFAQSIPAYNNPLFILRIKNKTVLCIIWTYCYDI